MDLDTAFRLDGQVAIVSAGGAGIGQAIASTFAAAGAAVVVGDLRTERADAVAAQIREQGGRAAGVSCDVTSEADLERLVRGAITAFGRITLLVNNAGGGGPAPFDMPLERFVAAYRLNVFSGFRLSQLCAPHMQAAGGGAILNISSTAGENRNVRMASYASSKAAVDHLTANIACDLGPCGIRVNAIAPGRAHGRAADRPHPGRAEVDAEAHATRPARRAPGHRAGGALPVLARGLVDQRPGAARLRRRDAGARLGLGVMPPSGLQLLHRDAGRLDRRLGGLERLVRGSRRRRR